MEKLERLKNRLEIVNLKLKHAKKGKNADDEKRFTERIGIIKKKIDDLS